MAEKDNITVTPKQIGVVLATIIAVVGGAPVAINKLNPSVRADPFTGTEGRALASRLEELEQWRHKHIDWSRDKSIQQANTDGRQDAQIEELYRRLK